MFSIEKNGLTCWYETEEQFKRVMENKGGNILQEANLVFNNLENEIVKCRYDLRVIIESWMYRKSHEAKMLKCQLELEKQEETKE